MSSTVEANLEALPQNQGRTAPSIGSLEDDKVIRYRNTDSLVWYYDCEGENVVLYQWNVFEPESRSAFSAATVMNHDEVNVTTVSRTQLETLRGGNDE